MPRHPDRMKAQATRLRLAKQHKERQYKTQKWLKRTSPAVVKHQNSLWLASRRRWPAGWLNSKRQQKENRHRQAHSQPLPLHELLGRWKPFGQQEQMGPRICPDVPQ